MAYPTVSNYLAEKSQGKVIDEYQEEAESLSEKEQQEERNKAIKYNESLINGITLTDPFDPAVDKEGTEEYQRALNLRGDGMMGYIEIPSIDVHLPIYHGTNNDVLEKGAGHLVSTSLPIGGEGTHAALSAHRGLPSAKMFTDLNKVKEKEIFYIYVLEEILAYEIDQIKVVEPHDIGDLLINRENDYVTLITCTPYGINTHRILVRGHRIPYVEEDKEAVIAAKESSSWRREVLLALVLAGAIGTIVLVVIKKRKQRAANEK